MGDLTCLLMLTKLIMGRTTTSKTTTTTTTTTTAIDNSIGSSLIPIINKLHDILLSLKLSKIALPHVAVIGSQSSGKSSVLESLVGLDFLPRGCEICTRRPLLLQLVRRNDEQAGDWGEFHHLPDQKFYDFSDIRTEIQEETEREAGKNKRVSDKPIRLKIFSPNVLDITLIDLPGVTKVPVGDQPTDIEARIREMIMDHIRQENCIILAVSPANSDLATSDALQMSKEVDPKGIRTIGVITKLDIMDRGTDACDFLLGKVIPLHLGYIGVINRSQADINEKKSVAEALNFEEQFLRAHPEYDCVKHRFGIPQLAKKLNEILELHIRASLPALKSQIKSNIRAAKEELGTYSDELDSERKRGALVLKILGSYSEAFCSVIDGKNSEISTQELTGGARIRYIFHSIFGKALEEVDPCEYIADDDIRIAIQNSMGPRNKLFVPEVPFELLIRKQVARLLDPSMQCLQLASDELMKMSHACVPRELQRFPTFKRHVEEAVSNFMNSAIKPVEKRIAETIEMEADDINTSHRDFVGGQQAIDTARQLIRADKGTLADVDPLLSPETYQKSANHGDQKPDKDERPASTEAFTKYIPNSFKIWSRSSSKIPPEGLSSIHLKEPSSTPMPLDEPNEDEKTEILVTKILLKSYFDIVRKKIDDDVPKAIMHFVVNQIKRNLHNTLIQTIYKEELFEELLQENSDHVKKRKCTREMLNMLQQAIQTLEEVESEIPLSR